PGLDGGCVFGVPHLVPRRHRRPADASLHPPPEQPSAPGRADHRRRQRAWGARGLAGVADRLWMAAREKVICVAVNYHDHALEQGADLPEEPLLFGKFASALI